MAGGKDVGDAVAVGSKVSVKYTERAGENSAVGVKDANRFPVSQAEPEEKRVLLMEEPLKRLEHAGKEVKRWMCSLPIQQSIIQ